LSITISIIIPVCNDPKGLKDTITSLVIQNYPFDKYEIVVIDNGSIDNTLDVAKEYAGKYPQLVKYVVEDKIQSSYAARNKGIKIANGSLICFIDADMTVNENYLTNISDNFDNNRIDYLGCNVKLFPLKITLAAKYNCIYDFNIETDIYKNHYSPTCCLTVPKKIFKIVGYFDDRLESGGDWEFGQRVFKYGFIQGYAEDIIMFHPSRSSYRALIKKGRRIARGIAQLTFYYPQDSQDFFDGYFKIKRYLPSNPFNIYQKFKRSNLKINIFECLILSFFHIPIRILTLLSLVKEEKKLILENK